MGQFENLQAEIQGDPLARGYVGMTDQQVWDSLIAVDRDNWVPVSGGDIAKAVEISEFTVITSAEQTYVAGLFGADQVESAPGTSVRDALVAAFGGGSTTLTNLAAIANQQVSRASEIGVPALLKMGSESALQFIASAR